MRAPALAVAALVLAASPAAAERDDDDRYLAGYAAAVIERDLGVAVADVEVEDGRARVVLEGGDENAALRVREALGAIDGIERVDVVWAGAGEAVAEDEDCDVELLPARQLFAPLLADPREPHFAAIYQRHHGEPQLANVGHASFGETFALLGGGIGDETRWELGILGGVSSIFDLDANSFDLVNSDYWVAPTFSLRRGILSGHARLFHRSSHVGDEFLIGGRGTRVDFGNEGLDLFASADLHEALRVYLGGGVILNSEPDIDRLSAQVGFELRSPWTFLGGTTRPVAALDFQAREELNWREELSVVWGVELANPDVDWLHLAILGTYFTGSTPYGQFFGLRAEWLGVGLHIYF